MPNDDAEEVVEVTALVERIENVEKENSNQKEKITALEKQCESFRASIDRLAELFGKRR